MWVYIRSEPGLFTVGFFAPDGSWFSDSDFDNKHEARARVHYLNGGSDSEIHRLVSVLEER